MTEHEWLTSKHPRQLLNAGVNVVDISALTAVKEYTLCKLRQYVLACRHKETESYPSANFRYDYNLDMRDGLEDAVSSWAPVLDDYHYSLTFEKVTAKWRSDVIRDLFQNPFKPIYINLQVGDIVKTRESSDPLHCGSGIYDTAVVVSINPFVLVSPEGDMMWATTRCPHDVIVIGETVPSGPAFRRWRREKNNLLRSIRPYISIRLYRPIDRKWLTWNEGTVPRIAKEICDSHDFTAMPILGDALEEAGCTDKDILDHCRNQVVHVKGCWVLELMLEGYGYNENERTTNISSPLDTRPSY